MMPHFPPSPEVRTHATRTRRTERRGPVAVIAAGFIAAAFALGLVALFAAMTGYRP